MSDEWLFYPCQMGEHRESTFYDHVIRETIDRVTPPQWLKVQLTFKRPRPDGLSSTEEFQPLRASSTIGRSFLRTRRQNRFLIRHKSGGTP
jgi:hypothetical protein